MSTVKLRVDGVGSVLPAASVARTAKLWLPSAKLLKTTLPTAIEPEDGPPSRLYRKVAPASVEWKVKLAPALPDGDAGPLSMTVPGAVVSTITVPPCVGALPEELVASTVYE